SPRAAYRAHHTGGQDLESVHQINGYRSIAVAAEHHVGLPVAVEVRHGLERPVGAHGSNGLGCRGLESVEQIGPEQTIALAVIQKVALAIAVEVACIQTQRRVALSISG